MGTSEVWADDENVMSQLVCRLFRPRSGYRTGLGPEFGPIARQKDSEFAFDVLSTPLKTHVLQHLHLGC